MITDLSTFHIILPSLFLWLLPLSFLQC